MGRLGGGTSALERGGKGVPGARNPHCTVAEHGVTQLQADHLSVPEEVLEKGKSIGGKLWMLRYRLTAGRLLVRTWGRLGTCQ